MVKQNTMTRRRRQQQERKRLRTATTSSTSSMVAVATMVTLSLSASCEVSCAFSVGPAASSRHVCGWDAMHRHPQRLEACLHATSTMCDHIGVLPPTAAYASSTNAFHTTRHKGGVAWDTPRYGGRSSSSIGFQRGSSSLSWRPHHDDALLGFQLFATQESDAVSDWQYNHPAQQHQMMHPLKNAALWMPYLNQSPTTTPTHVAPAWLPWIPTRTQIESLRVVELKGACAERTLAKTGNKIDLQSRLFEWTQEQHRQRVAERRGEDTIILPPQPSSARGKVKTVQTEDVEDANTRAWNHLGEDESEQQMRARLQNRRKEIKDRTMTNTKPQIRTSTNEKTPGMDMTPTREYMSALTKQFYEQPTAQLSNWEVKDLYRQSKQADQRGDRRKAKQLLYQLKEAVPHDGRVLRRLA
eukprot:scaffold56662_cov43-Attheya_sp.AAC.3